MHQEFWYGLSFTVVVHAVVRVLLVVAVMAIVVAPFVWAVRKYGWRRGWWRGVLWAFVVELALEMVINILNTITGYDSS
jgi:hypothetical protein